MKYIHDMKAGDIVHAHGGKFRVVADAGCSISHLQQVRNGEHLTSIHGPTECAVAEAVCIEGEIHGYFHPGSNWIFQGNFKAGTYFVE